MKAVFGSIVVDGRGKLGDVVYSRNRYGSFSRDYVIPANPATAYQTAHRALWAQAIANWQSMTQSNRDEWTLWAMQFKWRRAIGNRYTPSGYQACINCNINLLMIGASTIAVPAPVTPFSGLEDFTITGNCTAPTVEINSVNAFNGTPFVALIYATSGISQGINSPGNRFKLIHYRTADWNNFLDVSTEYNTRYGAQTSPSRIFVRIKFVDQYSGIMYGNKTAYFDS
jgi:hypothetical protein